MSSIETIPVKPNSAGLAQKSAQQRLAGEFIANLTEGTRQRSQTRKHVKSSLWSAATIDMKIGSSSFVSERTGRFTSFYRIVARIGEGGYGQVYKVQHKKTGMIRAMKSSSS